MRVWRVSSFVMPPLFKAWRLPGPSCRLAGHFVCVTVIGMSLPSLFIFGLVWSHLLLSSFNRLDDCSGGSIHVTDGEVFVQL